MNINFKLFSLPTNILNVNPYSFLKEQQKKIISIVTVVFVCLAAYAIYRFCTQKRKSKDLSTKKITVVKLGKDSENTASSVVSASKENKGLEDEIFDLEDDLEMNETELMERKRLKGHHGENLKIQDVNGTFTDEEELAFKLDFEVVTLSAEEVILSQSLPFHDVPNIQKDERSTLSEVNSEETDDEAECSDALKSTVLDLSDIASEFFTIQEKIIHPLENEIHLVKNDKENLLKCVEEEIEILFKEFEIESVNSSPSTLIEEESSIGLPLYLLLIENGSLTPEQDNESEKTLVISEKEEIESLHLIEETAHRSDSKTEEELAAKEKDALILEKKEEDFEKQSSEASSPVSEKGDDIKISQSPISDIEELDQKKCIELLEEKCIKLPEVDSNTPMLFCALANTLMHTQVILLNIEGVKKDYSAIDLALMALKIDPNYLHAYLILGREMDLKEKVEIGGLSFSVMDCYIKVIDLDKNYYKAYYNLGNLLGRGQKIEFDNKKWNRASLYRKTIELNPNYSKTYRKIAACLDEGKTFKIDGEEYTKEKLIDKANELAKVKDR